MSSNRGLRPLDPIFDPGKRLGAIAVGNTPGSAGGAPEIPRFGWDGLINALDESTPWRMFAAHDFTEVCIDFTSVDDIVEFDIIVNGSVVDTITTGVGLNQVIAVATISVVIDDVMWLDMTDFGTGLGADMSVAFR